MKRIYQIIMIALSGAVLFSSCEKADSLTRYSEATTPVLTASATTVFPTIADSSKVVLVLKWTDPGHAQDKSLYKYYIEIDSSGRNFSRSVIVNVTQEKDRTEREYSFPANELNAILLSLGFEFDVTYSIDLRVVSSYGNNNERKKSQPVKLSVKPYKIPPKVQLPASGSLYIVGSATQGDWDPQVPLPTQEFSKIDETTYGGIFQINGDQEYLFLPEYGSFDSKYAINDNLIPGVDQSGSFFFSTGPGSNFKAPAQSGLYKITVDFQRGIYNVEPFTQVNGLPSDLFIVGSATPGGWDSPVPVPDQQLTRKNSVEWEITLNFKSGEKYLLLPKNDGSFDQKFGAENPDAPNAALGGRIRAQGADFISPTNAGNYKLSVNFFTGKYSLTPQ